MQVFFDKTLGNEFAKIYKKFKAIELEDDAAYKADLEFLLKKLVIIDPLESVCEREDFDVVAIDGSGADGLISLNDIGIHLLTAAFAADKTSFNQGTTKQIDITPPICSHPEGILRLILLREDKEKEVWKEFESFIEYNYGEKLMDIVFRIIKSIVTDEFTKQHPNKAVPKMNSEATIRMVAIQLKFKLYKGAFPDYSTWMVSPKPNSPRGWFEQFREVLEYALAHSLLNSDIHFKYLFLDGSMNMLLSPGQNLPRLASNYLLKDINEKALDKDTCVIAVSKTTTFPFIYRLADDLEKKLGSEKKWYFRVPSPARDKFALNILKDRPHIPPSYGVTYLFHFSSEVPILRIDLDEKWWKEKIFDNDKKKEKQNEIQMFKEIDWLARDVRYCGYFFDLAFAHNTTIVKFSERDVVADQLIDYFAENGENPKMFIHPRKRLGLR
jgi:hypothetical protein